MRTPKYRELHAAIKARKRALALGASPEASLVAAQLARVNSKINHLLREEASNGQATDD